MLKPLRSAPTMLLIVGLLLHCSMSTAADWTKQDLATAAALRERALSGAGAFELAASLTSEVGPRPAGSDADASAVRWALNTLGSLGFSRVRTQDVLVPHWVRGSAEAAVMGANAQPLVAVALGGSIGTIEEGIEASVIEAASLDALKALPPASVKGKIVFLNQRMERTRDASGYGATVRNRSQGPSAAGNLGAAAIVIRSVGTSNERVAHTGGLNYLPDAPRIPAFALSNPDADLLARLVNGGKNVRLRLKSTARELPPTWSANVIGEIPGRRNPGEIVLLGAHLDSWDAGPGALDDAAGVAIVMEAARLIGKLERRPDRTIRVVLFANEEFGLSGAREYARLAGDEAVRHVIAMESDLGQGPVWRLQSQVAPDQLTAIDVIRDALQLHAEPGGNASRGGPDLGPLLALGVPILELSHDATDYFDVHHTASDTIAKVDAKILNQTVAAYAVAAYLAASKQADFGRIGEQNEAQKKEALEGAAKTDAAKTR